jgi:hypothetical protein
LHNEYTQPRIRSVSSLTTSLGADVLQSLRINGVHNGIAVNDRSTEAPSRHESGYKDAQGRREDCHGRSADTHAPADHHRCPQACSERHNERNRVRAPTLEPAVDADIVDYGYSDSDYSDAEVPNKTPSPPVVEAGPRVGSPKASPHSNNKSRFAKRKRDDVAMEDVQEILRVGVSRLEALKTVRYSSSPQRLSPKG